MAATEPEQLRKATDEELEKLLLEISDLPAQPEVEAFFGAARRRAPFVQAEIAKREQAKSSKKPDAVAAAEVTAKGATSSARIQRIGAILAALIAGAVLLFINRGKSPAPPPAPTLTALSETGTTVTQKNESNIQTSGTVGNQFINQLSNATVTQNFYNYPSSTPESEATPTPDTESKVFVTPETTELTPFEILKQINAVEPLRRQAVAESFKGGKVTWLGELLEAKNEIKLPEKLPVYSLLLEDASINAMSTPAFSVQVPTSGHEFLLLAKERDKFLVTGIIDSVFHNIVVIKFISIRKLEP